ncbi:CUB and sushi domain-containing protein 1-like [Patiria miniata]|uniref:G-protein coupled receptor GRL101 n=1 Tax=Patiria miniata TaxID=46514 RepID=A0A913ZIU5_PATMI|nr:CUB and sushi domain-containing protein 1-like [Patiria miniata]
MQTRRRYHQEWRIFLLIILANGASCDVPCGKSNITLSNSTQTSETLTSPYYPNNYPINARCIWYITVDEGSTIAFRFSVFNTERTYDTLTIGNGHESSDGDSVIGRFSGFLTNLSVDSNNHTAWMEFTSDSSVTEIGFEVKITQESYEGFCGERNITLSNSTQTSETLTSPYYPNNYPNNARCIWFITVDEGSTIAFRFSVFNTERTYDTLTIGNGHESSDGDSVIGFFSSSLTSLAVISNNHTAWVEFTSDSLVTEVGFEVKITQERSEGSCGQDEFACQDESSGLICLASDDTCDGDGFTLCPDGSDESNCSPCGKSNIILSNSTQTSETLTSPYYPNNYPNDAQCIWFITVDEGSTIAFRFSVFNTEQTYDALTIGNGHESSDDDSVIGLFSGVLTSLAAVSNNHTAWMEFTSDYWVTKIGFEVKITQESYEGYCGKRNITLSNSTQTSETLTSPYYPNNYPNNARCIWFITVDEGSTIAFRFSVFYTEQTHDALTIGNGYDSSDGDSIIGLLSSSLPSLAVVSNNHTAWMKFTSDSSVTEIGFEVNITQGRPEDYCSKGNITLSNSTQTSETLTSPYYPNNYPNNARCIWFITVDEGSTIAFRFSVFNTEQTHDTLTIGNGHEFSDGYSVIGHFSSSLTSLAIVSNNHTAWMKFTSDYSVTEVGFEVKITQERPEGFCGKRNITLNNSTQTSETLTSPYYPNNYPTNAQCIWFITVDEGSTIAFRFSVFKTEHTYDTVTIGNGHAPLDGESIIGRFNGFLASLAIFSSNHTAWMDFASDGSVTKIGFNVTITQERSEFSCGKDESVCEDASSGLICLTRDDTCGGFLLCPDELDESNCGPCREDQFQCSVSGLCIPASKHCDGVLSCDDNTDESGCEHCGGISTINVTNGHSFVHQMNYEPDDVNFPLGRHCVWYVTASEGYRVKITFREYMLSQNSALLFGHGEVQFSNIEALSRHGTYTKLHIISETNNLWIALVISTSMTSANRVSLEIEELRPVECNDAEFACPSGLACIPRNQVCDGYPHCPMKGDEFGCGSCYEHQFRCPEGGCIGSLYECNAIPGCLDLWDEMNCFPCGEGNTILDSTQTSATLTSVYYPDDYPNNALCIWLITADVGSAIAFRFSGFNTEKTYDMVTIGNGHAPSSTDSVIGSFSSSLTSLAVFSNNHIAWMKFTSDSSINRVGFQVTITQERSEVSCRENEFECKDNSSGLICLAHNAKCDGFALCPDGSDESLCDECGSHNISVYKDIINLNSPGYPNRYPNNHDCIWYIKGQSKQVVTMRIKDFEMEETYDYLVVVFLANGEDPKELFRLTGADISRRTVTWRHDDGVLKLEMKTDLTIARRGFSILINHIEEEDLEALCKPDEFHCGNGFCITNSSLCNGFLDCINYEDERNCDDIFCPGSYKCNNLSTSSMSSSFTDNLSQAQCIPLAQVCDGEENCPESDDEIQCDMKRCPAGCECSYKGTDLVVHCKNGWDSSTLAGLALITHTLQLSGVNISKLDQGMFKAMSHLKVLSLKNNRISEIQERTFDGLENLLWLDLSNTLITELQGSAMEELSSLRGITIFDVPLTRIKSNAFSGLSQVKTLIIVRNIEGLPRLVVEDNAFQGLDNVKELYVDDHRLCCFFPSSECKTLEPQPPLFMCSELMPRMVLKVFMWILGISALVGNIYVMVWRCRERTEGRESRVVLSFLVFNLAVSDALMGLYMLIIACADAYFGKSYFTVSMEWRTSPMCQFAGFISIIGTEASVFFLTLISIDRFLSIVFPFSHYHLRPKSSRIAALCVWIGTVIVGLVPTILASDSSSDVYGLSDVCIGLPLMTKVTEYETVDQQIDAGGVANITVGIPYPVDYRASWFFSIALFLGVNLLCFTVILICYIAIFRRVRASSKKVNRSKKGRDDEQRLAIKMAAIILTDFVCWVPVIIMGILSQARVVEIPTEAYAWIVVFILPINSSLNPYLYTIADLCYQQQKAASVRRKSKLAMKGLRSTSENPSSIAVVNSVTSQTQLSG